MDEKGQTKLVRPLRGGQITIPVAFRKELGLEEPGTILQATLREGELRLKPVHFAEPRQGSPWLRELYEYFAPVRQEAEDKGYTDDEVNAWIDEAVAAVRRESRG